MAALRAFLSRRATRSRGHWAFLSILVALLGSNGRLLSSPAMLDASKQLNYYAEPPAGLIDRLRGRGGTRVERRRRQPQRPQPRLAGEWRWLVPQLDSEQGCRFDHFLERALGVGYLKRSIAVRASQQQTLRVEDDASVTLLVSDRRGTNAFSLRPDDRAHSSRGYGRLPIKQRVKWLRDGSLFVEETYAQHLGGPEHGRPCAGISCPTFRQRRSIDADSGEMVVELERTLLDGETIRMMQRFEPL